MISSGPSRKKRKVREQTVATKSRRAMTQAEWKKPIMRASPSAALSASSRAACSPAMATKAS